MLTVFTESTICNKSLNPHQIAPASHRSSKSLSQTPAATSSDDGNILRVVASVVDESASPYEPDALTLAQ